VVKARALAAWIALAAAALLLAACSTVGFAYRNAAFLYDNAPSFLLWSLEDFIELTPDQEAFARTRLERAHAWHRREALPGYGRFLADFEREVDAGLTADAFRAGQERLRAGYREIAERLLPDAAELFAMLDARQVGQLARRLERADRKTLEEARGSRHRSIGRAVAHLEVWTGELTPAQRELVRSRLRALPDLTPQRVAEWRARQGKLVALLRERPPRDEMVAALRSLLFDTDAWREPAYALALRERDDAVIAMLPELASTLGPEQLANVKRRLHDLRSVIAKA
jgi:hypothetical protein